MNSAETDNAGVVAPPPLIFLGPLVLGLLVQRARPVPVLPRPLPLLFGWPLLAGGVALNLWFILTMRRAHTPIDPRQPVSRLVTAGPFQLSRNPSYTSFALIYVGVASLRHAFWPLLLLPAAVLVMQRGVIEREERYLARRFGAEYEQYKARVRRWL